MHRAAPVRRPKERYPQWSAFGLARKGARVTGLDGSWALLQRAQSFREQRSLPVRWVRGDMRRVPFALVFDLVLVVDAFGDTDKDAEGVQLLAEIRRVLHRGAPTHA